MFLPNIKLAPQAPGSDSAGSPGAPNTNLNISVGRAGVTIHQTTQSTTIIGNAAGQGAAPASKQGSVKPEAATRASGNAASIDFSKLLKYESVGLSNGLSFKLDTDHCYTVTWTGTPKAPSTEIPEISVKLPFAPLTKAEQKLPEEERLKLQLGRVLKLDLIKFDTDHPFKGSSTAKNTFVGLLKNGAQEITLKHVGDIFPTNKPIHLKASESVSIIDSALKGVGIDIKTKNFLMSGASTKINNSSINLDCETGRIEKGASLGIDTVLAGNLGKLSIDADCEIRCSAPTADFRNVSWEGISVNSSEEDKNRFKTRTLGLVFCSERASDVMKAMSEDISVPKFAEHVAANFKEKATDATKPGRATLEIPVIIVFLELVAEEAKQRAAASASVNPLPVTPPLIPETPSQAANVNNTEEAGSRAQQSRKAGLSVAALAVVLAIAAVVSSWLKPASAPVKKDDAAGNGSEVDAPKQRTTTESTVVKETENNTTVIIITTKVGNTRQAAAAADTEQVTVARPDSLSDANLPARPPANAPGTILPPDPGPIRYELPSDIVLAALKKDNSDSQEQLPKTGVTRYYPGPGQEFIEAAQGANQRPPPK